MKVHTFMHVPYEGLGHINDWIISRGHTFSVTQWHKQEHPPAIDDIDMLLVLGGPMGVHDIQTYPWLLEEKAYIKAAIEQGILTAGICLGSQIIAELLGSEVKPNDQPEIGWHRISLTEEYLHTTNTNPFQSSTPLVFQWHNDGFTLPQGAIPIASSPVGPCQGFLFKHHVLGLQFHLEMNEGYIKRLLSKARHELIPGQPYVQSEDAILAEISRCDNMKAHLFNLFDQWTNNYRVRQRSA
jgi:GMP synthase-like glutamine amidotransferase